VVAAPPVGRVVVRRGPLGFARVFDPGFALVRPLVAGAAGGLVAGACGAFATGTGAVALAVADATDRFAAPRRGAPASSVVVRGCAIDRKDSSGVRPARRTESDP